MSAADSTSDSRTNAAAQGARASHVGAGVSHEAEVFFDPAAIPLVGRDAVIAGAERALADAAGCIVVVGEPMAGVTRVAIETMRLAERRGARLVWADGGPAGPEERLSAALGAANMPADPATAAEHGAFAAYLGGCDPDLQGRLARTLSGTAGVVICESPAASLSAPSLRVAPLSATLAGVLVERCAPSLPASRRDQVVRLADGLPGCIVSLSLFPDPTQLPLDLGLLVERRLSAVHSVVPHEVLYWGAVLGTFDARAVAAVARCSEDEVADALAILGREGVLSQDADLPHHWAFVHQLTRWAVAGRRVRCLQTPARSVADAAPVLLEERLRLIQAAKDALRPNVLLHHTEAALAEWQPASPPRLRCELLVAHSWGLESEWRRQEALEVLEQAHSELVALGENVRSEQVRKRLEALRSRFTHGIADLSTSIESDLVPERSAEDLAVMAESALAALRMFRHERATSLAHGVLGHAEPILDVETRLKATLARDASRAFMVPTRENIDALSALRHEALQLGILAVATNVAIVQTTLLGDQHAAYEAAAAVVEETGSELEAQAHRVPAAHLEAVLGLGLVETGDVARAEALAFMASVIDSASAEFAQMWLDRLVGHVVVADFAQGLTSPDVLIGAAVNVVLAGVDQDRLSPGGREVVTAALSVCDDDPGAATWKLLLFVGAVEADIAPGRARWREELEALARWDAPAVAAYCRYADCFFVEDPGLAVALFRDAETGFASLGLNWWAARSRFMAGLVDRDDPEDALEDLRAARTAFEKMGAHGWRERVEIELRSRGGRWTASSGAAGGLSARELEVVRELAAGRSNAQIAQQLVLSENTVARHLTRIYRKLGVSGRREAVEKARGLLGGAGDET